jgi:hypothetical protein
MEHFISDISGNSFPISEQVPAESISNAVRNTIQKLHPDFDDSHVISRSELNSFRMMRMEALLMKGTGHLSDSELEVLRNMRSGDTMADKLEDEEVEEEGPITFGQRMADAIAKFGGSWSFIIAFLAFMMVWISFNAFILSNNG